MWMINEILIFQKGIIRIRSAMVSKDTPSSKALEKNRKLPTGSFTSHVMRVGTVWYPRTLRVLTALEIA